MLYEIKFHFHLKNSVLQKLYPKILEFIVFMTFWVWASCFSHVLP